MSTNPPKKTGPSINRGTSKQDYETPPEFMEAARERFDRPVWDLAATPESARCYHFYTKEEDSLTKDWHQIHSDRQLKGEKDGFLWLNPEYSDIGTWAKKCSEEMQKGARILFLVPASTGAGWYWNYVKPYAHVLHLRQRITFMGATDAYPKDMVLAVYAFGLTGESPWSWLTKEAAKAVKERTTKLKADIATGRV